VNPAAKPTAPMTLTLALIPILFLVSLLACSVFLFGADSSYGANQIALVLTACVAALVGRRVGVSWTEAQNGIIDGIGVGLAPILILLAVGMLIGSWILGGTVPAMIYYGVQVLNPGIFYAASAAICAIVALSIGSSWTVAGTLGIGLMGIAASFELSPAITAGAIVSGAYFGDTIPGLSDTLSKDSKLWAFEPKLESFRCAEITILLNKLNKVELFNFGIGEINATLNLLVRNEINHEPSVGLLE